MITPIASTASTTPDPALKKAAQGFEAVFLREIIGVMRKGKLAEDIFGSSATDNFREMADARTADEMSKLGHFGIAGLIEKQLVGKTPARFVSSEVETRAGEGISTSPDANGKGFNL
jgi:peptidoglycan hydrolase FlgJ